MKILHSRNEIAFASCPLDITVSSLEEKVVWVDAVDNSSHAEPDIRYCRKSNPEMYGPVANKRLDYLKHNEVIL